MSASQARSSFRHLFQSLEDGLSRGDGESLQVRLLLGVDVLALVDDDGETVGALLVVPADGGGELGVVVREEELSNMLILGSFFLSKMRILRSEVNSRYHHP